MGKRIISLLSVLAVMAGIIIVSESAQTAFEGPETVDTSESFGSGETESGEESFQTHSKDIFADSAIVDLGNHKAAYLTGSYELERSYGYEEWIAVQKLDKGNDLYLSGWDTLFIPVEGVVTAIEPVDGFTGLRIKEKTGQEVRDRQIPVCFFPEKDYIELYQHCSRVIPSVQPESPLLPAEVWTETIGSGEEKYELSLERISIPYKLVTDFKWGEYADYRLTVRDGERKEVQKLILTCGYLSQEDIHWMIDIDGDGFRDLIFCADHVSGRYDSSTQLVFLVWNNDNKRYEEKRFDTYNIRSYFEYPIWNAQESALMCNTDKMRNNWVRDREMYRFVDGEWQLYARLIPSSDEEPPDGMNGYEEEIYYKELDYYYIERRYEAGKVIGETIFEEAPYQDEQSMWNKEREGNVVLVPGGDYFGIPFD